MSDRPPLPEALSAAGHDSVDSTEAWRELTAQIGREVAGPLSSALERVIQLTTTGRIDRPGLRLLRAEIERARRIGIVSQQLARFTSKRLRQSHERLNLASTLQAALAYRQREIASRGIHVKQSTRAIEVLVDPALLFSLLNAMLDWAIESARSTVDLRVDLKTWPVHGRISCSFTHAGADDTAPDGAPVAALDSLNWHLVTQIARVMGLELGREDDPTRAKLVLVFPRTVNDELEGMSAVELDHGDGSSLNSKPLAGSQVLVVAARREVRVQVRNAIANMGLVVDFVGSVEEAVDFCRDGLPHAIIFEAALRGERLDQLAEDLRAELPGFSFLEIVEEGNAFEISGFNGMSHARVGRDGLAHSLPSALVFELSKSF
jgi:CheY-like chemotaxis protein